MVSPRRDSTVVTIGELDFSNTDGVVKEPRVNIVQHYRWTGRPHVEAYPQLVDLLKDVWRCRRVVVDATGIGEGVASFVSKALGSHVVQQFKFTGQSKSRLGFELLAAVNAGRVKMYARDDSTECQEFWEQVSKAKGHFRPNQTMNFFVEPSDGHDDFLMSLALLLEASRYTPRKAQGQGSPGRASPAPTGFNGQSNRGLFLVKQ